VKLGWVELLLLLVVVCIVYRFFFSRRTTVHNQSTAGTRDVGSQPLSHDAEGWYNHAIALAKAGRRDDAFWAAGEAISAASLESTAAAKAMAVRISRHPALGPIMDNQG
jgi:hypothetical protein